MPWINLGTVVPALNNWSTYAGSARPAEPALTYRFTATNISPGDRFKSYILVRFEFYDVASDSLNITSPFRIYPYPEPLIRELPVPQPIIDQGVIAWFPQAQKKVRRNFIGTSNEPSWGLKIEEYTPDPPPPP